MIVLWYILDMDKVKRVIVGVDNDDVLVDFIQSLVSYSNKYFGTSLNYEDMYTFNLGILWGCSQEESVKRVFEFYNSSEFIYLPPVEGSLEALKKLNNYFILRIVSSRPASLLFKTKQSLDSLFPNLFERIHLTDSYGSNKPKKSKLEICREEGITVLIDDNIDNLNNSFEFNVKPILFRRPWNRHLKDNDLKKEGISVVQNWDQIVKVLINSNT